MGHSFSNSYFGYILLERNVKRKEGQCGIAMDASYPVLDVLDVEIFNF
jgi:hypothetical protein